MHTAPSPNDDLLILIGRNDTAFLRDGWHPIQTGPADLPCRWMSTEAVVDIGVCPAPPRRVTVTISAPLSIQAKRPGLSLYRGSTQVAHCANLGEHDGAWYCAELHLAADPSATELSTEQTSLRLVIEHIDPASGTATPLAFIPHEVLGNGDLRALGAQISSIHFHF